MVFLSLRSFDEATESAKIMKMRGVGPLLRVLRGLHGYFEVGVWGD